MVPLSLLVAALVVVSTNAYEVTRFAPSTGSIEQEILPSAQFSAALSAKTSRSAYKNNMRSAVLKRGKASDFTAILAGSNNDNEYLTDIMIGGQTFQVIVDTGSSDTWLAEKGFKCFNLTSYPEPPPSCGFGSEGFDKNASKTWTSISDKNFNISYGDGEFLTGEVGTDTVTVGGLTVAKQEIGLVTNAAWTGDGVNTGLMGLAYPDLTSVFNGTNPDNDTPAVRDRYNPFFWTAVAEKVVTNPYFSVALNRGSLAARENSTEDPNLGYLAFGGIASVNTVNTCVTTPIQGYSVSTSYRKQYLFYTVDVDAYSFNGSKPLSCAGKQAILDTGTTLNYLPSNVAQAYNSKFVPKATFNTTDHTYYVSCNATVPAFTVEIAGTNFTVDGQDQIIPAGTDINGNEVCISGTQDGGDPSNPEVIYILGDVFLHNVVVTFNIQTNMVTLTQRAPY